MSMNLNELESYVKRIKTKVKDKRLLLLAKSKRNLAKQKELGLI